jgi:tRNA-dihydrouridine synthase
MIAEHYEEMLAFYGQELGLRVARKHLGWYLDEAGLNDSRAQLLVSPDKTSVLRILQIALSNQQRAVA